MKKKIAIILLALCMILMTACGSASPTDALKADLENAKSSPEEILGDIGEDGFGEEASKALIDKVLEFDYKLGEEKIDGDSATVELTITTYPFGDIFTQVVGQVLTTALSDPNMTEEQVTKLLDDSLLDAMNAAQKTYAKSISAKLKKENGKWVVQEDETLSNALTGGMLDFASNLMG